MVIECLRNKIYIVYIVGLINVYGLMLYKWRGKGIEYMNEGRYNRVRCLKNKVGSIKLCRRG